MKDRLKKDRLMKDRLMKDRLKKDRHLYISAIYKSTFCISGLFSYQEYMLGSGNARFVQTIVRNCEGFLVYTYVWPLS